VPNSVTFGAGSLAADHDRLACRRLLTDPSGRRRLLRAVEVSGLNAVVETKNASKSLDW